MNNNLNGSVKVLPVNEYTVWYESVIFEGVQRDAVLVDGDGDFLMLNPGWGNRIIHVSQVKRIITHRIAENEELYDMEVEQYETAGRE